MSAEILRRAAALMRERAEAVNEPGDEWWNVDSFAEVTNYDDAEHFVAFGRPAVALAVADWLDVVAETSAPHRAGFAEALAVATAYLGESA